MTGDSAREPIRMGQLREGDTLVRYRPPVGELRVTGLVKSPGGHLLVQYQRRDDGSLEQYETWTSTHAFRRAPADDSSVRLWAPLGH